MKFSLFILFVLSSLANAQKSEFDKPQPDVFRPDRYIYKLVCSNLPVERIQEKIFERCAIHAMNKILTRVYFPFESGPTFKFDYMEEFKSATNSDGTSFSMIEISGPLPKSLTATSLTDADVGTYVPLPDSFPHGGYKPNPHSKVQISPIKLERKYRNMLYSCLNKEGFFDTGADVTRHEIVCEGKRVVY